MTDQLNYNHLRNPIWILGAFVVMILPDFLAACQLDASQSIGFLVSDSMSCPNTLLSGIFIGHSILSLFMVIVLFEVFRLLSQPMEMMQLPSGIANIALFEFKALFSLLLGIIVYSALAYLIFWIGDTGDSEFIYPKHSSYELIRAVAIGFGMINLQLIVAKQIQKRQLFNTHIKAEDNFGSISIEVNKIDWFEKEGRHYYANTVGRRYKIPYNLQVLEDHLDQNRFTRINRSVIININIIHDYSHWEHEKYILRTNDEKEFVVSRKRINHLKELLKIRLNRP